MPAAKRRATSGARVLAVANQKGGVAKTTTVASLGAAFADQGKEVLLVDLDAQACLTFSLGIDPDAVELSVNEALLGEVGLRETVLPTDDGMDLVPAVIDLAAADGQLMARDDRERVLRRLVDDIRHDYDVIVLDCSPSLGLVTINALTAADGLLIPMPCEMLAHRGVGQLLDTVTDVQRLLNPGLEILGVLPTMYDGRSNHAREVLADVGERYGIPVLDPPIPRTVRFAEAPATGRSILASARGSRGALAYREVADALWPRLVRAGSR